VFLVTTFSSGAAATARNIVSDPTSATSLLAQQLPTASNFYISYFILYGLALGASTLLDIVPLLKLKILGRLDSSPRKMFNRYTQLPGLQWGSIYPKFTNLAVIGTFLHIPVRYAPSQLMCHVLALAYSCIAPLVLGFATIGLYLLYLAFRYNHLFVLSNTVDTKGAAYARALQQLTVGVYIAELCLIGLFAIGASGSAVSTGPLVLMIIFTVLTALYHVTMRRALNPLTNYLPSDLFVDQEEDAAARSAMEEGVPSRDSAAARHSSSAPIMSDKQEWGAASNGKKSAPQQKLGIGGKISRFLFPQPKESHHVLKDNLLEPDMTHSTVQYDEDVHRGAYLHPAIIAEVPKLWIARDELGVSEQEVRHTGKIVPITDEGAWFDEKGKVRWDEEHLERAPLWEDRVCY